MEGLFTKKFDTTLVYLEIYKRYTYSAYLNWASVKGSYSSDIQLIQQVA